MISYNYFSEIEIPTPPLEEQEKIAAFLDNINKRLISVNKQYELIQEYKKGLIQNMYCV
jgi:type I restriction enzyme S subunit